MDITNKINILSIIINIVVTYWHISVAKKQNNISLFHEKKEHYQKYIKINDKFCELDKCPTENFHNICDEIEAQLRDCAEDATLYFKKKIPNLEDEISKEFSNCINGYYNPENKKDEIFNNIVRTKYQECREKIKMELQRLL